MNGYQVITEILQKDRKQNTYKFALIRAINAVAQIYPDITATTKGIAIPLKRIAEWWLAYYWAFVDSRNPIWQAVHKSGDKPDMVFRDALTEFRVTWQSQGGKDSPAEGYNVKKMLDKKPAFLGEQYQDVLTCIQKGVKQPIIHAGTTQPKYFGEPQKLSDFIDVIPLPNTQKEEVCFVVPIEVWKTCQEQSEQVEALCVDAWCLFIQDKAYHLHQQSHTHADIYPLLTTNRI